MRISRVQVLVFVVAVSVADVAAGQSTAPFDHLTPWGDPDFRGTYVSDPRVTTCDVRVTSAIAGARGMTVAGAQGMKAVHITQSPDTMWLRVAPPATVRVLHIQARRDDGSDLTPYIRTGIARWDGAELLVVSAFPTLALWGRPFARGVGPLIERLSLGEGRTLKYTAWYDDSPLPSAPPRAVEFWRCGDATD